MKVENKKINFEDARGSITDIFTSEPREHCTIIMSKKGSVRGNHYHKFTHQSDFMVSGKMIIFSRKKDSSVIEETIVGPYDFVTYELEECHEFIALEDLVFVTFHNGPRGGDDYESDTFRLPTPLHKLKGSKLDDLVLISADLPPKH